MMAISPDLGFAGNVLIFIICAANWFNGIIVPYSEIQAFWRYWVRFPSHLPPFQTRDSNKKKKFITALLPQPLHLPARRHGNRRHRHAKSNLFQHRSNHLLFAPKPDLWPVRRLLGRIRPCATFEPGRNRYLQRVQVDHGRTVSRRLQSGNAQVGRDLGILGHIFAFHGE